MEAAGLIAECPNSDGGSVKRRAASWNYFGKSCILFFTEGSGALRLWCMPVTDMTESRQPRWRRTYICRKTPSAGKFTWTKTIISSVMERRIPAERKSIWIRISGIWEKRKDLFGAEALAEKGGTRKASSGKTAYRDRDYSYRTRSVGSGDRDYVWLNGQGSGRTGSGALKWILLAVLLAGTAAAVWLVLR